MIALRKFRLEVKEMGRTLKQKRRRKLRWKGLVIILNDEARKKSPRAQKQLKRRWLAKSNDLGWLRGFY